MRVHTVRLMNAVSVDGCRHSEQPTNLCCNGLLLFTFTVAIYCRYSVQKLLLLHRRGRKLE